MLIQRTNPLTCESEWVTIGDPGCEEGDAASDIVAASSYLDMLSDLRRNRAYRLALERAIKPDHQVLDIGTGTGLLAMMAARCLDPASSPVVACELFPPMANLARRVIQHNGYQGKVNVVMKRSDDMTVRAAENHSEINISKLQHAQDHQGKSAAERRRMAILAAREEESRPDLSGKADLIVTEIFDSQLLGEGLLPTLQHAVPQLLKDGGLVIPARASVYGQLVECPVMGAMAGLSLPQNTKASTILSKLVAQLMHINIEATASVQQKEQHGAAVHSVHELHVDVLYEAGLLKPLGKATQLLAFDLDKPPQGNNADTIKMPVDITGSAHAIIIWWQLKMDKAGQLLISTAPGWIGSDPSYGGDGGCQDIRGVPQQWRDHWKQCWAPMSAISPPQVQAGGSINVLVSHDEVSLSMSPLLEPGLVPAMESIEGIREVEHSTFPAPCLCEQALPLPLNCWNSPLRIWQLNDTLGRWTPLINALNQTLMKEFNEQNEKGQSVGIEIVVLGDGPMLPLIASAVASQSMPSKLCSITSVQDADIAKHWLEVYKGEGPAVVVQNSRHYFEILRERVDAVKTVSSVDLASSDSPSKEISWPSPVSLSWPSPVSLSWPPPVSLSWPPPVSLSWPPPVSLTSDAPIRENSLTPGPSKFIVVAEPYYRDLEGLLPWFNLRYWSQLQTIRMGNPGCQVVSVPSGAALKVVAVSLPDLWRTRAKLGIIEGIDLTPANRMLGVVGEANLEEVDPICTSQQSASTQTCEQEEDTKETWHSCPIVLPYPTWQCGSGYQEMSDRVTLMEFNFDHPMQDCVSSTVMRLCCNSNLQGSPDVSNKENSGSTVHALVFWMDYNLGVSEAPDPLGGPMPSRQGILLLQHPLHVVNTVELSVKASFSCEDAEIEFSVMSQW